MTTEFKILTADQVKEGETLPPLSVDVTATTVVLGALASRDWRPMHHDKDFAIHQGVKNIFLNTPNQAAWFERYLTDWTGPLGRVGRMKFKMRKSVCPGDRMVLHGVVEKVETDELGCFWAVVAVRMDVEDDPATICTARIAIPRSPADNPWKRRGEEWKP